MPNINEMRESRFAKKEDFPKPALATIKDVKEDNVGTADEPESKWTLLFREDIKPLVLNWTNIQACAAACGSEDTDSWPGCQIVLYNDESIMFRGQRTGGIRIRTPKQQTQKPAQQPAPNTEKDDPGPDFDDDIPF